MNKISVSHPKKWEIISRVFQRKEGAKNLLLEYNLQTVFNPYIKRNNTKTGYYICYYSSWNECRCREWYKWLKNHGLECYLVKE